MKCAEFMKLSNEWSGNVCLFGAGQIGRTWAYELIRSAGFRISFYCDNNKAGEFVNGLEVRPAEYLYANSSGMICFITVGEPIATQIREQLEQHGITDLFVVNDVNFISELARYRDENPEAGFDSRLCGILSDEWWISRQFKDVFGFLPDLRKPKTMNEKIQWLKLHDRKPEYGILADKYRVREYIGQRFGEEYLVPLLYATPDYRDITAENIPDRHCIVKSNCSSHDYEIIRSKEHVDWNRLQQRYKKVMESNFYYVAREWCYKDIKPMILVEELLETEDGKIPNDYKLHFFNGECEFIYCAIDREGMNYRKNYDMEWNELPFDWSTSDKRHVPKSGPGIPRPKSFRDMLRIGSEIARDKPYVRVDFYDVDGKLYCGEITLYHGAGYDRFIPEEYDGIYGRKLVI